MLNEYNCWLQERITARPAGLYLNEVYHTKGGEVANQAAEEFRLGIKRLLGFSPGIHRQEEAAEKKAGVFLGTKETLANTFKLSAVNLKDDGFIITTEGDCLIIAGQDERGLLYGVFRFLSLLALGKADAGITIKDEPASSLRMINHWDNIEGHIERGYAGNSLFFKNDRIDYDKDRIRDYARLLASVGINRISINNVNVRGNARFLITDKYLGELAALAGIFRPFGIRLMLSVSFAAPMSVGKLPTSDPLDPAVVQWWKERADEAYKYIPDLAGFLIKADSEGQPGPFQYGRNHADGANMLAGALKDHGGEVIWRCFVYNSTQDWRDHNQDRPRAVYDHFMPLDGTFDSNVILQIKWGPYDFQVREPVTPLFGALKKTRHLMELQITQEYTGQQIDLCFLPWLWQDIMSFDTAHGDNSSIRELVAPNRKGSSIEGFAGVVNTGLDRNWTGNTLAQANLYGYGRIIWNPALRAEQIAEEWCGLSFGSGSAAQTISGLLLKSYSVFEKYNAPFGTGFMVTPGMHYGPNIDGYEFTRWGTYHRADTEAIGIDRTHTGTGFSSQYAPANAAIFGDPAKCPENVILFFHRLRYDYIMKNGETLLQNIYDTHFEGCDEAAQMLEQWKSLENVLEAEVYKSVLARFERQLNNAGEWRDQINTYFRRKTGIRDKKGRKIYE